MTNPVLLAIAFTCAMLVPRSAPATTNISSASGQPAIALGPKPGAPWENSLGMKFVPVPGTNLLFCIWETRVQDFEAFVKATGHNAGKGWRDPEAAIDYAAGFSQTPLHPVGYQCAATWAIALWLQSMRPACRSLSLGS